MVQMWAVGGPNKNSCSKTVHFLYYLFNNICNNSVTKLHLLYFVMYFFIHFFKTSLLPAPPPPREWLHPPGGGSLIRGSIPPCLQPLRGICQYADLFCLFRSLLKIFTNTRIYSAMPAASSRYSPICESIPPCPPLPRGMR